MERARIVSIIINYKYMHVLIVIMIILDFMK